MRGITDLDYTTLVYNLFRNLEGRVNAFKQYVLISISADIRVLSLEWVQWGWVPACKGVHTHQL
jgi:hypothetical protein